MKVSTCNNAYSCRKQNHPLLSLSSHDILQMLLLTGLRAVVSQAPSRTLRPHLLTHTCPARPLLTNLVPRPALRAHCTMRAADAYLHVSAAQPRLRTKPADAYSKSQLPYLCSTATTSIVMLPGMFQRKHLHTAMPAPRLRTTQAHAPACLSCLTCVQLPPPPSCCCWTGPG
jgi:hypothetical protein